MRATATSTKTINTILIIDMTARDDRQDDLSNWPDERISFVVALIQDLNSYFAGHLDIAPRLWTF